MRRPRVLLVAALLLIAGLCIAGARLGTVLAVGVGFSARVACALVFNSGMDPDQAMARYIDHQLGPGAALIRLQVDRDPAAIDARALGIAHARAIHRRGAGCSLVADADEAALRRFRDPPRRPPLSPGVAWPRGNAAPPPPSRALKDAIDAAFAEPEGVSGRLRQTVAVVIARHGELVAERYAPGFGPETPLLSWSSAKSVISTLVGVAALENRIDLAAPAPVPEWQGLGDRRGAITTDALLRMSSGLAFDETYGSTNDVSRMLFTQSDTGRFAAGFPLLHEPDTVWSYSSGTSNIQARILRDLFDGDLEALVAWSRNAFFEPMGMRSAYFGTDASGSFVGSSFFFATARDYARFGQLHLEDGVWNGRRLLPEGWTRYVRTPTQAAPRGEYGAGWWLNAGAPDDPSDRMWSSLPRDVYAARGMSGQYVVVVPSAELVVVRLGLTQSGDDVLQGIEPLIRAAIDATRSTRP